MSAKIAAILAAVLMIAVGGAVFMLNGSHSDEQQGSGTSSDPQNTQDQTYADDTPGSSSSSSSSGTDESVDDSGSWAGTDTVIDDVSGLVLTYVSGTEGCYTIT